MDTEAFEKAPSSLRNGGEDKYSPQKRKARKADNVDPLTEVIGQMGWFQITWYMLVNSAVFVHCWQMVVNKFLTYPVSMKHCFEKPFGLAHDELFLRQTTGARSPRGVP